MDKLLSFSPEELTEKEQKKLLIGSVIPRPIALVTTMSKAGVINVAPFSYFNIVTYNPPMLSIAVQRVNGESKDTARNILENKEAVVHVVSEENVVAANKSAASLGPEESELEIAGFTAVPSKAIKLPGINEAKVRFETSLYESLVIYDKDNIATTDLLLLTVEHFHIDESVYHDGYISAEKLRAVSRLAGSDYAEIGKVFTLKRPE
ncbi:MAG TPA: flavin reductase family protein [Pseudogracilibacillus sp.]|nr:flavin reductase family protein [Pseudogracilibacillus sp.]